MSDPYKRLDEAMRRRRLELGMKTWRDLSLAAGISYETLRALRNGEGKPADATVHGLERALQWELGSVQRVLDDKDPLPVGSLPPATAEMHGTVTSSDEAESPVAAQFLALLTQARQQTEDRMAKHMAELNAKIDEQKELMTQQSELIQRLLDERKGA